MSGGRRSIVDLQSWCSVLRLRPTVAYPNWLKVSWLPRLVEVSACFLSGQRPWAEIDIHQGIP